MNWETIITENLIFEVMPEEYAGYRAPVREILLFFLERLPETRQSEILENQIRLPPTATAAERISALARSCPSLHKLGQTLARDRRLSPELRKHLQRLESLPSSVSPEVVRETVTQELGPPDSLDIDVLPAIAEASVAVVVPFRHNGGGGEGVLKILKPGIKERLEQELEILERTGSYLDRKIADFGIPRISYRETFEQVREKLLSEVRLELEQRNLRTAHDLYSDEPRVLVPALCEEYCTRRITAMEMVRGRKITEPDASRQWLKGSLAELAVRELIARPLFSKQETSLFHGDPHAGNLFVTDDGRLAILDWSLAGSLSEREHRAFTAIILGALMLRPAKIEAALAGISQKGDFDRSALRTVVGSAVDQVRDGRIPGLAWMTSMLDEAVKKAGLLFSAELLLFRRVIHILDGVMADIGGASPLVDEVLIGRFLASFMFEWPFRWFSPPDSREFATRISNSDIAELMMTLPWTAARFWLGQKT